jgi:hypothetical protein
MTQKTYKHSHRLSLVLLFGAFVLISTKGQAQRYGTPVSKTAVSGLTSELSRIQDRPLTELDVIRTEHAVMRANKAHWELGTKGMSVYGRVLTQAQRTPILKALVVVAKEGFDAEALVRDLIGARINPRTFADRIAWYGYTDLTGIVVIPDLPRNISISAVSLTPNLKLAPFSISTRLGDPDRLELCPVYVSR